jgi:inosine-uridine nucleoside N-ribohydrolase
LLAVLVLVAGCRASEGPVVVAAPKPPVTSTLVLEVQTTTTTTTTAPTTTTTTEPVPETPLVVFDSDMGPDVDDVVALAVLHTYQRLGLVEIAAVTVSRPSEAGVRFADAVNTFYGYPDIPLGMYRGEMEIIDDRYNFTSAVSDFPHDVDAAAVPDGSAVMRQVLADAAAVGREVIVVQVGFSGNVSDLLDSAGDEISPLAGVDLVQSAQPLLSVMAGSIEYGIVEYNVEHNISAARNLMAKWPAPMAVSPFELGNSVLYPYSSIQSDYVEDHPLRAAYEFKDLSWHEDAPPFYNMRSWDVTSVMHAVEPEADYFLVSQPGTFSVAGDGRTSFAVGEGRHVVLDRFADYTDDQRQRIVDRMIELASSLP